MNRHALQVLEFEEALSVVARYAASGPGAEAVRGLEPSDARAWVEPELRRVDQMVAYLLRRPDWGVPGIPDVRLPLRRLGISGFVLEGSALRDAAAMLRSSRAVRRAILPVSEEYPLLSEIASRLAKLEAEESAISRAIDDAGEVRDEASPELARLRREARAIRSRIVERLEQYMESLPERIRVPDASVSVRDGRYVIPIRREGRAEVGGIVHDESATGQTLFVEPPVAIEAMNRLRELELAAAREVQRILRELTDLLRPHADDLQQTFESLVAIDSLYARARYALEYNGHRPELLDPAAGGYAVVRGYHPLLLVGNEPVVPFDLVLEPGERTLIVSGPNTGGKTVLLKAIGLISALTQAGVIPPVGPGTRIPLFRDIFADIGDEQSIEASLSTFSAHLKNLKEILEHADAGSLVLIDEIGSGTDPTEGAALARAILLELTRRGTLTVATSHLGELKLMAGEEPGVVNASLLFDARELRPTYRLVKGVPGRSYGLAIARRLGFPDDLLALAESFVPQADRDVSQLLLELEEKERRLEEALEAAERAAREVAEARRALEAREHEVRKREREAEQRARQQARDLLLHARSEVEAAIRELREAAAAGASGASFEEAARRARRKVEEAALRQRERLAARQVRERARPVGRIEPGTRVRIEATGATGTVVEVRDDRATVETSGLRMQVPLSGLVALEAGEAPKTPGRRDREAIVPGASGWTGPAVEASPEVDLRGLRADEVASRLESALDAAVMADLPSLRIIHGKGTGALRQVVADLLREDPRVRAFRVGTPGEGGAGVTIAELA